jgi:signal transduction histidine kinase/CheY-like chemotaxis protein/AraC-like DNA-binding protein
MNVKFPKLDEQAKKEYVLDYNKKTIPYFRFGLIITLISSIPYAYLDISLIPENLNFVWIIRFAIWVPVIIISYILTYFPIFKTHSQLIGSLIILILGFSVETMIAISDKSEFAYTMYYAGIAIIMLGVIVFRFRLKPAIIVLLLLLFGYIFVAVYFQNMHISKEPINYAIILLNNVFFLFSFTTILIFTAYILERLSINNFVQKQIILQEQAIIKEKNEFQNHFFVNITHELRTPLTLIKGNVFGAKKMEGTTGVQEKLDAILMHSTKIENLINNIIDVTKAEANTLILNIEPYAINQVIQKQYAAFKSLFEENGINFTISLLEKDVEVEIDKLYFERVIGNILINAVKYTPKGGIVTILIKQVNSQISISVEDDGIGIGEGEEMKIFNRFYQVNNDINKANGSGIGLAFCKEVIQLTKGSLFAFQNKGGGATFSITLPMIQSNVITENSKLKIHFDTEKPVILLVDDNADMRAYIRSLLINYNVIEASDGLEALAVLEIQPVNALITDYMMPKMDGYELIKQVKEKEYDFPILVITARADVKSKLDVLALGIDDYLTKPFIEEELLFRLRHSLLNAQSRTTFHEEELSQLKEEDSIEPESDLIIQTRVIIEENIENPLFGVPDIVDALGLTERTLYRKVKASSGLTPNQLIREIKLLFVRNLVEQNNFTSLIQLTEKVGFKNSSHLQKLYKERFGTTISV